MRLKDAIWLILSEDKKMIEYVLRLIFSASWSFSLDENALVSEFVNLSWSSLRILFYQIVYHLIGKNFRWFTLHIRIRFIYDIRMEMSILYNMRFCDEKYFDRNIINLFSINRNWIFREFPTQPCENIIRYIKSYF
jgi:hypothetical protein